MKYCPYCGAELIDGAVSFCSECGAKLAASRQTERKPKKKTKASKPPAAEPAPDPEHRETYDNDRGYDGYYDDVLPEDDTEIRQGLDKKLVKKIALLGVAVIFIIGLAVLAMYFL